MLNSSKMFLLYSYMIRRIFSFGQLVEKFALIYI